MAVFRSCWFRMIVGLVAVVLGCIGLSCLCIYSEYIRADFAAPMAKWRVERIYTRTRHAVPDGATLVWEQPPKSGTYAWGLSAGADRYVDVRSRQTYLATTSFSEVLAAYRASFKKWGWVTLPIDDGISSLSVVFRRPGGKKLLVGICTPVGAFRLADPLQYTVFFDYDETSGCEGSRLACLASRYCE
jgi:hypothetical protein